MPLSYRVERTCNRHSRAVYKDDEIVIRLAQGLTHTEEHNHIVGLVQRMQRMVERDRKRRRIDPFRPLLEETSVLEIETMSGNVHMFALVAGGRTKAIWNGQDCALHIGPKTNQQRLHRTLWKALSQKYRATITEHVFLWNDRMFRTRPADVRVRAASSQWGSCSPRDVLTINPALLFVPTHLLDYVVVHELAHREHHNHSRQFWSLVERTYPQYVAARRALRAYKLPQV